MRIRVPLPWLRLTITHVVLIGTCHASSDLVECLGLRTAHRRGEREFPAIGRSLDQIDRVATETGGCIRRLGIEQMDAGEIALAALGGLQAGGAADGQQLGRDVPAAAVATAGYRARRNGCR